MTKQVKYKDTGLEWCPQIPERWELKKVNNGFGIIGSGTTPSAGNTKYYDGGVFNWLQTGDLTNNLINNTSKKITQEAIDDYTTLRFYEKGSLVIAMYGATIGKVGLLNINTTTNQACCVLSNPIDWTIQYVYYWFIANKKHIVNLSYGGGQPNISQQTIRDLRLPTPPLQEQQKIADYLDKKTSLIDSIIAKKEELIKLGREERTAIINHAVTKGLNRDAKMKDSGIEWLGEIPEHWEVCALKYLISIANGEGIKGENLIPTGNIPVYGGNGILGYTDTANYDGLHIIIGRVGAKCGNVRLVNGAKWISDNAMLSMVKDDNQFEYITYLLESLNLNHYSNKNAQPLITGTDIKNIRVGIPSQKEQQQIVSFLDQETKRIDTLIEKTAKQIDLLKEYKEALINEVVTGQKIIINI